METKGSILCDTLFQQWGNTPRETGVTPFTKMSHAEQQLAHGIWRQAWSTAVAQAARSQEGRSSRRHGYDKHADAEALLRALSFDEFPEEPEY